MKTAASMSVAAVCLATALLGARAFAQQNQSADLQTFHVQGKVHLVVGAGANVVVQVGEDGVTVVDPGLAQTSDKVIAAIRRLSKGPIRWIINTTLDSDHTGGNEAVSKAGRTVNGNPAAIISHEKLPLLMVQAKVPDTGRPFNTFFGEFKDFSFNGDAVFVYHVAAGHTDGDSLVYFRGSDVIVAGDIFLTTTYPVVDVKNGGSVQGMLNGLNKVLELAVPRHMQEGGTYIIPGHGRVCDEADVLAYRDMIAIVRDRVQDMIQRGMTLDQVRAARPTRDYDPRYAADAGPASTAMFVEAVYRDLTRKK